MITARVFTFHRAWNYGACLQAKATTEAFKSIGIEAGIVDYVNAKEQSAKYGVAAGIKNVLFGKRRYAMHAFESDGCYIGKPIMDKAELDCVASDILVSGSDQIWNPEITGGLDDAFFLQHGVCKRKIAYGPSIGSKPYSVQEQRQLLSWLEEYHAIGVRDSFTAEEIQKCTHLTVQKVCDPTLLLPESWWRDWSSMPKMIQKPYVLIYLVGGRLQHYRSILTKYMREIDVPIYYLQVSAFSEKGIHSILGANLREFVGLIENASLVITDSFHGAAFSLNMRTPLLVIDNPHNPVRVRNLLKETDMNECRMPELLETVYNMDYYGAQKQIDRERKMSLKWLDSVCND